MLLDLRPQLLLLPLSPHLKFNLLSQPLPHPRRFLNNHNKFRQMMRTQHQLHLLQLKKAGPTLPGHRKKSCD